MCKKGTQPEELTPTGQKGIPYHIMLCSAINLGWMYFVQVALDWLGKGLLVLGGDWNAFASLNLFSTFSSLINCLYPSSPIIPF